MLRFGAFCCQVPCPDFKSSASAIPPPGHEIAIIPFLQVRRSLASEFDEFAASLGSSACLDQSAIDATLALFPHMRYLSRSQTLSRGAGHEH
jgi:hypothetical protein